MIRCKLASIEINIEKVDDAKCQLFGLAKGVNMYPMQRFFYNYNYPVLTKILELFLRRWPRYYTLDFILLDVMERG